MTSSNPKACLFLLFFIFVFCGYVLAVTDQANCREALGMQNGKITDNMISASSSYDEASVGPKNGRVHTERNGGAWCPLQQISKDVEEWIQVDFQELKVITLVETQGRFGNGQGQEYAEKYMLEYQRLEDGEWKRFHNRKGNGIFEGNSNTYHAELREINPPIIARKIRVMPYSTHPRTVCMRIELYGCPWKDGILSYNIPQGERRGSEVDLYDFTYDGVVTDTGLSGGLGQLTDGEEGHTNFRLDPADIGHKGYGWVGWKNDTVDRPPVQLLFEFDKVRNFSSVRFHCNNMFTKDVRVFKKAEVYFSVGGKYFSSQPVTYHYMRDALIEYARPIIIPIPNRIGKFAKILLYFDARWIMISEVRFESEVVTGNYTEETQPSQWTTGSFLSHGVHTNQMIEVNILPGQDGVRNKNPSSTKASPNSNIESKASNSLDDQYIGIIVGALAALLFLLCVVVGIVVVNRKRKYQNGHRMKSLDSGHVTLNLNDLRTMNGCTNEKVSNGNMYNAVSTKDEGIEADLEPTLTKVANGELYREPADCLHGIQARKLPDLPSPGELESNTDTCTSREYAVPDITKSAMNGKSPLTTFQPNIYREESPPPPPLPPHPKALYGCQDSVINYPNLQGVSGNCLYAVPNPDLLWKDDYNIMEFPRDTLKFVEKLGEGQFGEVHLCEATNITDFLEDDFLVNRTGSRSMMVAVKMLRRNADQIARDDFHKEVKIMSKLKDPNIVLVLGVCTQEEPLCVIVEYMKYGDLNQFLRQHVPENTTLAKRQPTQCLSYGCLIYMATQMASGMKYLEGLNMVHRDLATRNCLVGNAYTIKISDFGMSRSLYSADYYRIEGKAVLPIRWMAWESVLLGKFSSKSDVWSFSVTLWEILTYAREQPFDNLSDEEVIANCGHYYRNDREEVYLPSPEICPKEIFDLMKECWNREEVHRPAFREIHMFLQRKNMGYNPREETMGMQAIVEDPTATNPTATNTRKKVPLPPV